MSNDIKRLVALANSLGGTEEDDIMWAVAELEQLRAALQFYANPETYMQRHGLAIEFDNGEKARRALENKP